MNAFKLPHRKAMTLVELMLAALIFIPVLLLVVLVFIRYLQIMEFSKNASQALLDVRKKIHQIELTNFSQISSTYNSVSFPSNLSGGRGVSYVQTVDGDLVRVIVTLSWREKNGRIVGEDTDLDGILDAGEDKNANGRLDSPVKITTLIYNM